MRLAKPSTGGADCCIGVAANGPDQCTCGRCRRCGYWQMDAPSLVVERHRWKLCRCRLADLLRKLRATLRERHGHAGTHAAGNYRQAARRHIRQIRAEVVVLGMRGVFDEPGRKPVIAQKTW